MALWMIIANLILLASAAGTIPVWVQLAEISKELALIFGFAVFIVAIVTSVLVIRKAAATKKRCAYCMCLCQLLSFGVS